jgi:hypothetical protein
MTMLTFLSNSSSDFVATETVGGFNNGSQKNSFDDIFTEAYDNLMAAGVDLKVDINSLIKNKAKLGAFKDALIGELKQECADMANDPEHDYGTHSCLYEQVSEMFDNCVNDFVSESTRVPALLPIKAVDFPVLVKQQLKLASKDIMQTEITKTPIVKKHIEQTYIVDPKTQKRWKYPQCFFNDEFKEVYAAGKGLPIKNTPVDLPAYDFDVIGNLTDGGVKAKDDFTFDLRIEKVILDVDGEEIPYVLPQPMRINVSDNTWLGGKIDTTVKKADDTEVAVKDVVMGVVDFVEKTVTLNSAAGKVKQVIFSGFLSNERNERAVTFDYAREEREWKIEDGMRADVPYSLEELEDTKALMDIDLYKKTYNNLGDLLTQMEDSQILSWLDEQFEKYKGVELDPLQWNSFITEEVFDCDSTSITTALPSEYIEKMLKFKIDRMLNDIADKAKMDDFTFVIYGNPRFVSLLNGSVNWVTRPGSTSNGVKLDYGYGIMTSGDIKVQVVSTKKVNAKYDGTEKTFSGLRIIPFPLSQEQFTFKHYKYTTHILTAQNSAYRSPSRDGGSYTYLVGTSRYTNAAIQGIQAQVRLANAEQYISL